jgi:NADH-quinone oxidoreductase subunit C
MFEEYKDKVIERIREGMPDVEFEFTEFRNELTVKFDKANVVDVARFLRDDEYLQFNYMVDVTAVDWATRSDRFEVVYNVFSMKLNFRLRFKVAVDESDLQVETVSGVWKAADWYERETYDMYGIKFANHPDLRRFYMPEEFEHYPLRKDFPVMGIPGSLTMPKK